MVISQKEKILLMYDFGFGCTTKMSTSIFCQAENEYHRARNQELVNLQEESLIRHDVQQKNKFKLKEGGLRVILTNQNKLVLAVCGVTALAAGRGLHCKKQFEEICKKICKVPALSITFCVTPDVDP
ncbi:hypothetical protein D0Y65_022489 [Glycine soja]|uniref:Uncharacterized protein n=1 Tax=Glycine soja TaxID=3848 RepID=A0A445JNV5_GLYSO|nr:hypothetical protein JHK87_023283 [Glycine soja]RZC00147.1 hypothetical protein D0Y65_022489 [Glycine soja]